MCVCVVESSGQRRVGSIADYDPMNNNFGSIAGREWEETTPEPTRRTSLCIYCIYTCIFACASEYRDIRIRVVCTCAIEPTGKPAGAIGIQVFPMAGGGLTRGPPRQNAPGKYTYMCLTPSLVSAHAPNARP